MIYLGHKNLHQQPKFLVFFFFHFEENLNSLFPLHKKVTKEHLPVFAFVSLKSQDEQKFAEGILQMENKSNQADLLFLAFC